MSTNQEIVTNLETLLAAVEAQPEDQFNLDFFRKDEPCGTLFCVAGLATTLPRFQAEGYTFNSYLSGTVVNYWVEKHGMEITGEGITDTDFGTDSWDRLFAHGGGGVYDAELGFDKSYNNELDEYTVPSASHKELAIARLKRQIAIYKGEAA